MFIKFCEHDKNPLACVECLTLQMVKDQHRIKELRSYFVNGFSDLGCDCVHEDPRNEEEKLKNGMGHFSGCLC